MERQSANSCLAGRHSTNSVDAAKVTDHHALLVTENRSCLSKDEKIIYDMICAGA